VFALWRIRLVGTNAELLPSHPRKRVHDRLGASIRQTAATLQTRYSLDVARAGVCVV
jgi:hypothetical protein